MRPEERRAKALELHLAGATYDAIATACGYAGRSGAYKAVQEALKDRREEPPEDDAPEGAFDTELARLDAMLRGLWPKARKGDVAAVDRVLRIEERRNELRARLAVARAAASAADEAQAPPVEDEVERARRRREEKAAAAAGAAKPKRKPAAPAARKTAARKPAPARKPAARKPAARKKAT